MDWKAAALVVNRHDQSVSVLSDSNSLRIGAVTDFIAFGSATRRVQLTLSHISREPRMAKAIANGIK
jgi:hypothetical protein